MLKWRADASSLHEIAKVLDDQTENLFTFEETTGIFVYVSLVMSEKVECNVCVFYLRMIDKLQML